MGGGAEWNSSTVHKSWIWKTASNWSKIKITFLEAYSFTTSKQGAPLAQLVEYQTLIARSQVQISTEAQCCVLEQDTYLHCLVLTPYNRLLRRQITASTTDQGKFSGKWVSEVFLFTKINKQICGLQLMIENIFNVWRYCSSNLTLFQVQISFLSARQNLHFKKIA